MPRQINPDQFLRAYMVAALWSSHGPEQDDAHASAYACEYLDERFDVEDIAESARDQMEADCADFIEANRADLEAYCERMHGEDYTGSERAGHDFWLTRNGHGAGFWDRGLGDLGDRLSKAAKVYGSVDLYPGDDGKVYA